MHPLFSSAFLKARTVFPQLPIWVRLLPQVCMHFPIILRITSLGINLMTLGSKALSLDQTAILLLAWHLACILIQMSYS